MGYRSLLRLPAVVLCLFLFACASVGPSRPDAATDSGTGQARATKRLTLMVKVEPATIVGELGSSGGGGVMGAGQLENLVHDGLSVINPEGLRVPRAASTLPTVENGLWKIASDGRMELTWKLNPAVRWHDGVPFTSADLPFTLQAKRDRELPFANNILWNFVEGATAPDPQTITVSFNQTYIYADNLFTSVGIALPRHLLEETYREREKPVFMELPYWNEGYVGVGPFKMREWARGSHYLLSAYEDYFLGRPKLGEIRVIFVADAPVMVATLLTGVADLSTSNLNIPLDMALDLRDRWADGNVLIEAEHSFWVWPQFINPNPPIIGTSVQFRRALYHALDRESMGTAFNLGLSTEIAHNFGGRHEPSFASQLAAVPKYEYDPRRAEAMLNDLGYQKGSDGLFRDRAGEILKSEIRATTNVDTRVMQAIAAEWTRFGMQTDPVIIPQQRTADREYRGTFPGFLYTGNTGGDPVNRLRQHHSKETPLAETNFVGLNTPRYRNPELDALIERLVVTVPLQERWSLAAQAQRLFFDQVAIYTLWYQLEPAILVNKAFRNIGPQATYWNMHEWEVVG